MHLGLLVLASLSSFLNFSIGSLELFAAPASKALAPAPAPSFDPKNVAGTNLQGFERKYQKSKLTYDQAEIQADHRVIMLTTGEDKTIDLDFGIDSQDFISIGNQLLLTATLVKLGDKRQLLFKPLKAGETTITVREKDGTIRLIVLAKVSASNLSRIGAEVRSLLRDIEGIQTRIVGVKVVLEGEIVVPADHGRIITVLRDPVYNPYILNLTTFSPFALQYLAKKIQEDVAAFAPNVKTRIVNGLIFLEGSVESPDEKTRVERIANLYVPEMRPGNPLDLDPGIQKIIGRQLINSFLVVNPAPPTSLDKLIKISVHFVELDKNYEKNFGFKWQPGFTTDPQISLGIAQNGQATGSSSGLSGTLSSLFPKLSSGQTAGYSRVLKSATLIVRNEKNGTIEDSIDFPVTTTALNGQTSVSTFPVGLMLSVLPTIYKKTDNIDLKLKLRQSATQGASSGANSAPTSSRHSVETELYVKSGESAAVAGMTAADLRTKFNTDPNPGSFAGDTVPLFSLIRSKIHERNRLQFVVFITPQIIDSASEATEDLKKNFRIKVQ